MIFVTGHTVVESTAWRADLDEAWPFRLTLVDRAGGDQWTFTGLSAAVAWVRIARGDRLVDHDQCRGDAVEAAQQASRGVLALLDDPQRRAAHVAAHGCRYPVVVDDREFMVPCRWLGGREPVSAELRRQVRAGKANLLG